MEETAERHISALRKYLESHLVKEKAGVSNQRQSARDKLTRLTKQQFQELSTDVYDEMSRRVLNSPEVPFLQVRDDFHPKRNQARQKLATLPTVRFKDLASDVFFELERRYPNTGNGATTDVKDFPPPYKHTQNQYPSQIQYQAEKVGDNRDLDPYHQGQEPKQPATISPSAYNFNPHASSTMPGQYYTQQPPSQNSPPLSVPAPQAANSMTTIVAKQQTATVQRIAPSYVVQKNSYENSSSSDPYGYQDNSMMMNGYGSGVYPKSSNEFQDSSFHYSTDSTESSQQAPPRSEGANQANNSKSGYNIDQMISKSAAAAVGNGTNNNANYGTNNGVNAANVSGTRNDSLRLSTSSSVASQTSLPTGGTTTPNNLDSTAPPLSAPSSTAAIPQIVSGSGGNLSDPFAGTVNFSSLDSLMADLGSMIRVNKSGSTDVDEKKSSEPVPGSSSMSPINDAGVVKMTKDYELRIDGLRRRVMELEAQAVADNPRLVELEEEVTQLRAANARQSEDYRRLQEEFRELLQNHEALQSTADKSQKETESLMSDLRELSREYEELRLAKGKDEAEVRRLAEENSRLTKELELAKQHSYNLKAMQSSPLAFSPRSMIANESILTPHEGGAIEPQRITAYQEAIDDLLRSGRSDVPTSVLMAMKAIVIACKAITEDIESHERRFGSNMSREEKEKLFTLKSKFSATLTNLMTAAKNHATGFGVSPVSLLDANAGNLTATVVEIVKLMKMKNVAPSISGNSFSMAKNTGPPQRPGSVDSGTPENRQRTGSTSSHREQRHTSPPSTAVYGSDRVENFEVDELKVYLERQTDSIVQAIQTLLQAMRQSAYGQELFDTISSITEIVTSLVSAARATFSRPSGSRYKARGEMILQDLENSNSKLSELRNSLAVGKDESGGRPSKQKFASASFEIAKYVKELVGLIE